MIANEKYFKDSVGKYVYIVSSQKDMFYSGVVKEFANNLLILDNYSQVNINSIKGILIEEVH